MRNMIEADPHYCATSDSGSCCSPVSDQRARVARRRAIIRVPNRALGILSRATHDGRRNRAAAAAAQES